MKKRMQIAIGFCIAIFLMPSVFSQNIKTSETRSINELDIVKRSIDFKKTSSRKTMNIQVDVRDISVLETKEGYDLLKIENCVSSGKAGSPTTYIYPIRLELEKGSVVNGIELSNGQFVKIENPIKPAPRKKPVIWNSSPKVEQYFDQAIYQTDAIYPQKAFSYNYGQNNSHTIVNIQLNISYFNPSQKKAFILTDAKLKIFYSIQKEKKKKVNAESIEARNIILTTEEYQQAANQLKNVHENSENVSTEVITKEWISNNYTAANPTETPGYATISNNPVNSNYDYELAKKIIAYLNDEDAHPNLESITILGDANMIPPSYYFYIQHFNNYNNWIPSDMHYSSPDYDMTLNFMTGRLPASTLEEASNMVNKIQNFTNNLDANWFYNAALIGGIPFHNKFMYGESICLDPLNRDHFKGFNIVKKFASLNLETPAEVLPLFTNETTGMIFHIGHGSGSSMELNTGGVSYSQLMGLSETSKYPVIFSIACMNGGYDAELIDESDFTNCFGEGALRSPAGGIAYFGGTRVNYGAPDVTMNAIGQVSVDNEPHMAKMLTSCFAAYSDQNNSLGLIYNEAFAHFMATFDEQDNINYVTAYEFVLLGDPVINLLPSQGNIHSNVTLSTDPNPFVPGSGATPPVYYYNTSFALPLNISGETNSPSVNIRILDVTDMGSSNQLVNTSDNEAPFEYLYEIDQSKLFQTRFETADFKETWMYFTSEVTNNIPPSSPVLSEVDYVSDTYDLHWTKAKDYDGEIAGYSLMEMKTPTSIDEGCNDFEKWSNTGFTINPNGNNSGNCFYSNTGDGINNKITTISPVLVNANDELVFWKKYNIENNYDYAYVEISEDGDSFTSLEQFTGASNSWTKSTINLQDYVGKEIYLQFRYTTDQITSEPGFYVDDISPIGWFEEVNTIENIVDTNYQISNVETANYFYKVCSADNNNATSSWSNTVNVNLLTTDVINNKKDYSIFSIVNTDNNGGIRIKYLGTDEENYSNLTIYNLMGQVVYRTEINNRTTEISLANQSANIFLFQFAGKKFQQNSKIFIK